MACMGQCTWVWSESMGSWMPGYYNSCESGCICGPAPGQEGPYDGYVATVACESTGGTTTTSTTAGSTTTTTTPSACASSECCWLAVRIETGGGSGYMAWAPSSSCSSGCTCSVGFPPYNGTDPAPGDVYCAPCVEAATTTTSTTIGTTTTAGTFTTTTTTEATTTTTTTEETTTTTTTATAGTNYTLNANSSVTFILNGISTSSAPDYVLRAGGSGIFILNGIATNTTTTTTTSTEGPLGPNSYNCFSDHNNPTGDVPPPDYKVYLCDWKGTPPQTFSGTWYCTNGSPSVCPTYPTTPTAVTFTRAPCSLTYLAPEDSIVPFRMGIPDPMLPSWADANAQALAIGLTGFLPAHPTGTPSPACTCGTGTIFLSYEFTVELCHFHIEITAVTF